MRPRCEIYRSTAAIFFSTWAFFKRDIYLIVERQVVPRLLVAEDARALEGPDGLLGDGVVILMHVVQRRASTRSGTMRRLSRTSSSKISCLCAGK